MVDKSSIAIGVAAVLGLNILKLYYSQEPTPEPTRQEFKSDVFNLENEFFWDIDRDGRVDLITDRGGSSWIRFYRLGYDIRKTGYELRPNYSLPMSSNLEEVATVMLKNSQELRYQEVKTRYDFIKNKNSSSKHF